jgi:1,4-alpha-glucan branching enzyme
MEQKKCYWCPQLHAHLPFVRHPEFPDFLEEDWLYEAISETYLPLLSVFEKFVTDGVDFALTMTITPSLANMLADPLLQSRYYERLNRHIELIKKELVRVRNIPEFYPVVELYDEKFTECKQIWEKYGGNILNGFKNLQDIGKLEIITCCATHGFLPLMNDNLNAQRAQIKVACEDYERLFGRRPRGIWLSECAYYPEIDKLLKDEDIRFFFVETHGILYGTPRPKYGVFAPVYCPNGIAVFARDMETASQVWSAETGYPGDPDYREFYKDLGYDCEYEYIRPYLHSDGIRRNIGIKYHRITGKVDLSTKQPYIPSRAKDKAARHAGNFLFNRTKQAEHLSSILDRPPVIVSMYDAELFGHWWFEGPDFLNFLFRKMHYNQSTVKPITPMQYLEKFPINQVVTPAASSWGAEGYYKVWLNPSNDYIYRHLHKAAERMIELAEKFPNASGNLKKTLNQSARELLLAQSSDWAFIMTSGTMVEYAHKRTKEHILNFTNLYFQILSNSIDMQYVEKLERKNNIFPNIDYRVYL